MSSNILLNVLDIYLDSENPRHLPIYDQPKIIGHLLKDEKVKQLAKHISLHGINPLDSIGVIKDAEANYISVEGNRRLCALLLLNDPEKAPAGEIQYFKRLLEYGAVVPNSINCVLFDSPDEADIWVSIRHDGEQDGIGIRSWNPDQKARKNGRTKKKDTNALALALIDYAIIRGFLPEDRKAKIFTTAARYLGNPFLRETFGITSTRFEQDVKINVSCTAFDCIIQRFSIDLLDNKLVHSRSSREDWIKYAKLLIEQGVSPKEKTTAHLLGECLAECDGSATDAPDNASNDASGESEPTMGNESEQNENVGDEVESGGTKNPDLRKYIIPSDFKTNINNKILRRVFQEMKTIEVNEKPLAVSQITRAFLENLYSLFYEVVTGSFSSMKTHILIGKVIDEIEKDQNLTKAEKGGIGALKRVQSNESNALSPKTLGANAHAGIYPDATQLKREFDNISATIIYMLKRL
tara:strand:- start:1703 stop:3103 length:1401 start_codon:yes stop_codon:yes gene_type:complete